MLTPYRRGATWWAKGRVEYNGRPISGYVRESTGASDEAGARDWIAEREDRERRRHLIGEEEQPLTFAAAVMMYQPTTMMARYLKPLVRELGGIRCDRITPGMIRDLGPKLYPDACTDTWRRWVVTPSRAVINNANDKGRCPPIKVKGYSEQERIAQDKKRKRASRLERRPGDWTWLLQFRQKAPARHGALALFMFATGARVGQSIQMTPKHLAKLKDGKVTIPGAKGHADREIQIPPELVAELGNLTPRVPRGWKRTDTNKRVFGFASSCGPLKAWQRACREAGIPYLSPHAAGRHGFGQEYNVRQPVDEKAAGQFGGWSDLALMKRTYTHAEGVEGKIHAAFRTGLVQAEIETGLKLMKAG